MRGKILLLVPFLILCSAACLISTQEGERTHINAPYPEGMAFHFDTEFNKFLLIGRSTVLLLIPVWLWRTQNRIQSNTLPVVITVIALAGSGWLFMAGWTKALHYRLEINPASLTMNIPPDPAREIAWNDIESIYVEGAALNVDMVGGGLEWAPEWEDLSITLGDGQTVPVDLRPLSFEQRGNFWRAIVRNAGLRGRVQLPPPYHRP
jgi:hypothetical protein